MFLCSCSTADISKYASTGPAMEFDQFFNGPIKGWGMVQDRHGKVIKRFDVDMVGRWQGNEGTLEEEFVYYDGEKDTRVWRIQKIADHKFIGRADDIVGDATGESNGMAIKWNYVMKIDVKGKSYDVSFDDWMFQMNDGVIMNRSTMKKFGFRVGEVTVFMQKQAP